MDTNARHDERQTLAVPRYMDVGDVTFFLGRDGRLTLAQRPHRQPAITITPKETYALLQFLRFPGVAELIEQQEAARQAQTWRDFEDEPLFAGERQADK